MGDPRVRATDSGTAVGAAVIALLIGLWCAAIALDAATRDYPELQGGEVFPTWPVFAVGAIAWLLGAGLLFLRTAIGRVLVIIDSVFGIMYLAVKALGEEDPWVLPMAGVPLIVLLLAMAKSTEHWIAAKTRGR
ncbi:hypothetical protein [Nocardia sp. XZ_19_385]|uniref:hypothetical protein n=1 Tax=Nocardia sp. XZ_19_385 TaxID=2769488 RepID=UPI00188DD34D|nr:hypothetical protein [Nocardia sp. XZ_19_385]